jgi:aspartate kinase
MGKTKIVKIGGAALDFDSGAEKFISYIEKISGSSAIIIVSAIGKSTRILRDSAVSASKGKLTTAKEQLAGLKSDYMRFAVSFDLGRNSAREIVEQGFSEIEPILKGVATIKELSPRILDKIMARGEVLTGRLLALLLELNNVSHAFIPADELIITDENFGTASPDYDKFSENFDRLVTPELQQNKIVLTQGFIASTGKGDYSTMGFESSNYTAALIAGKADADELEVISDTPGIRQADPKLFPGAPLVENISYQNAEYLADLGLNLLHKGMLATARENSIPVRYSSLDNVGESTLISSRNGKCVPIIINTRADNNCGVIIFNANAEITTMMLGNHFNHLTETRTFFLKGDIPVLHMACSSEYLELLLGDYEQVIR